MMISDIDAGEMENGSMNSFRDHIPEMKKCSEQPPSEETRETNTCSSSPSSSAATTSNSTSTPTEGPIDEGDAKGFDQKSYHTRLPSEPFRNSNGDADAKLLFETFTPRDSPFYNVSKGIKLAVVFNHSEFKQNRMPERKGTEKDVQAISQTFAQLNFDPEVLDNPTYTEILGKLESIQKMKNLSCLALFILSHGEENGLLHSYEGTYTLNKHIIPELLPENCPSLAGKPKLIFIQACQGENVDDGVNLVHRITETDGLPYSIPYCIPNYSDFLIFSAAYNGYFSFRSPANGSWFIQALCDQIKDSKPDEDLNSILTKVSFYVAIHKTSNVPNAPILDQKKQVPLKQDTLLRKIYLKSRPNNNHTGQNHRSTNNVTTVQNGNDEIFTAQTDDLGSKKQRNNCNCM